MDEREGRGMKYPTDFSEHIRRVVEDAPPLTETQKCQLASLLQPAQPVKPGKPTFGNGHALDEMLGVDHVG
jgi:hypothetical protein